MAVEFPKEVMSHSFQQEVRLLKQGSLPLACSTPGNLTAGAILSPHRKAVLPWGAYWCPDLMCSGERLMCIVYVKEDNFLDGPDGVNVARSMPRQ